VREDSAASRVHARCARRRSATRSAFRQGRAERLCARRGLHEVPPDDTQRAASSNNA
jgi:hypothetical protein